ncbi:MAG: NAD-dependent epimerase/dehydratase family protein [Pirellulales bacterium]
MKVLVTGAGGFLGLYVVEQLVARGDTVRGLCRHRSAALDALGVETIQADLCDHEAAVAACAGMDTVFHVAGTAGIWGPWAHYYDINTLGTRYILEGCRKHGVRRLVYTSSSSVTFDGVDQEGLDESIPYAKRWLCHYPHSKALAEQEVLAANGLDGLWTCSMRPHLIWGPRDRQLVPRLLARAEAGQLCQVDRGTNRIDIIYVENAAAAHIQAADALGPGSPVNGRPYFISQGEPINCWQWINDLLTLAGQPAVTRVMSASAAWVVGSVLEAFYRVFGLTDEPRMTRFLAAQLSRSQYFDISGARRDFGYEPKISTAEGMRRLGAELAGCASRASNTIGG